jgi:Protein of unknown function (DUF4242)
MAQFLVELYVSRADRARAQYRAERAQLAAETLTRDGTAVHHLRSILVPEDETCFLLFEAPSSAAVRDALLRAAVPFERVVEVVAERCANGVCHASSAGEQEGS